MRIHYTVENTLTDSRDKGKETVFDIINIHRGILYTIESAGGGLGECLRCGWLEGNETPRRGLTGNVTGGQQQTSV